MSFLLVLGCYRPVVGVDAENSEVVQKTPHPFFLLPPRGTRTPHEFPEHHALRQSRILFAGFVARMEDTRLLKRVMFGELVGGAGSAGGQEKEWMGCRRHQKFQHPPRQVDDRSPGRGGMA